MSELIFKTQSSRHKWSICDWHWCLTCEHHDQWMQVTDYFYFPTAKSEFQIRHQQ